MFSLGLNSGLAIPPFQSYTNTPFLPQPSHSRAIFPISVYSSLGNSPDTVEVSFTSDSQQWKLPWITMNCQRGTTMCVSVCSVSWKKSEKGLHWSIFPYMVLATYKSLSKYQQMNKIWINENKILNHWVLQIILLLCRGFQDQLQRIIRFLLPVSPKTHQTPEACFGCRFLKLIAGPEMKLKHLWSCNICVWQHPILKHFKLESMTNI